MCKLTFFVVLLASTFFIISTAEELQIATGKIKGKIAKSETGVEVKEFLGIKYGTFFNTFLNFLFNYFVKNFFLGKSKRFEKAVPVNSWSGVLDATEFKESCIQFGFLAALQPQSTGQSEGKMQIK